MIYFNFFHILFTYGEVGSYHGYRYSMYRSNIPNWSVDPRIQLFLSKRIRIQLDKFCKKLPYNNFAVVEKKIPVAHKKAWRWSILNILIKLCR